MDLLILLLNPKIPSILRPQTNLLFQENQQKAQTRHSRGKDPNKLKTVIVHGDDFCFKRLVELANVFFCAVVVSSAIGESRPHAGIGNAGKECGNSAVEDGGWNSDAPDDTELTDERPGCGCGCGVLYRLTWLARREARYLDSDPSQRLR